MSFPLKLTVFTNVYNEEYMLPFWLEHHKGIFDHGVVFDWDSTDSSMDIVRKVCPTWEIIKAPQKYFDAYENDVILMNEEMKHTGYKMVLNTTEFLISPNPIRQYLSPNLNSYYMRTVPSVLSTISYQDPRNLLELFSGIERVCIGGIPITDRAKRCIHSYNHGHYSLGRHRETLPITEDIPFYTIWFGFYPWNPKFHQRKLQIKDRIPMSDIQKGSSRQHMETQEGNEYRRKKALELSTPIDDVPFLRECLNYSILSLSDCLLTISKKDCLPYNHVMYLRNLKERGFEPKVIYDIGSCVLHWTNKAKEIWPDATYILFDGMREAEFLYSGYQYHMGVLCEEDNKELKFYKNIEEPGGNSYYREIGHPDSSKIFPDDGFVIEKGMTLDTIVKQKGFPLPDLIKMDIQGAEKDVLQGGQMVQSHAKHLIVEMQHVNYNDGAPKVLETGSYIESLGWSCCAPRFSVNYADADYGYERVEVI